MSDLERNLFISMILIAAAILSMLLIHWAFQPTLDRVEWQEEAYCVEDGESLWSISYKYVPRGVERREWIDEVKALNNLPDSVIYPGQLLTVLVPVDEED